MTNTTDNKNSPREKTNHLLEKISLKLTESRQEIIVSIIGVVVAIVSIVVTIVSIVLTIESIVINSRYNSQPTPSNAKIIFTEVPDFGEGHDPTPNVEIIFTEVLDSGEGHNSKGKIKGKIKGLDNFSEYRIVIYSYTNLWYVQPEKNNPYTIINRDGTWYNDVHLGDRYAAILVENDDSKIFPESLESIQSIGGIICFKETSAGNKN